MLVIGRTLEEHVKYVTRDFEKGNDDLVNRVLAWLPMESSTSVKMTVDFLDPDPRGESLNVTIDFEGLEGTKYKGVSILDRLPVKEETYEKNYMESKYDLILFDYAVIKFLINYEEECAIQLEEMLKTGGKLLLPDISDISHQSIIDLEIPPECECDRRDSTKIEIFIERFGVKMPLRIPLSLTVDELRECLNISKTGGIQMIFESNDLNKKNDEGEILNFIKGSTIYLSTTLGQVSADTWRKAFEKISRDIDIKYSCMEKIRKSAEGLHYPLMHPSNEDNFTVTTVFESVKSKLQPVKKIFEMSNLDKCILVDPAGTMFDGKRKTYNGSGMSGKIYEKLGIANKPHGLTLKYGQRALLNTQEFRADHRSVDVVGALIHAVGPNYRNKGADETYFEKLENTLRDVFNEAEKTEIDMIALPLISAGVFKPKKIEMYAYMNRYLSFVKKIFLPRYTVYLQLFQKEERNAYLKASKCVHYTSRQKDKPLGAIPLQPLGVTGSKRPIQVKTEEGHFGATSVAFEYRKKFRGAKIGVMVAANSGRPLGAVGDVHGTRNVHTDHQTQEEDVVSAWLVGECGEKNDGCYNQLYRDTVNRVWGMKNIDCTDGVTIQGVNYMTTRDAEDYGDAYVVRDVTLQEKVMRGKSKVKEWGEERIDNVDLVFCAGPNAGAEGLETGSTKRTLNKEAQNNYKFFKQCLKVVSTARWTRCKSRGAISLWWLKCPVESTQENGKTK